MRKKRAHDLCRGAGLLLSTSTRSMERGVWVRLWGEDFVSERHVVAAVDEENEIEEDDD